MNEEDQIQNDEPLSLRDTIEASVTEHTSTPDESAPAADGRSRDEQGRFAPKAADAPTPEAASVPAAAPVEAAPTQQELSTWRKEMRPLQAKLAAGQPLTLEESRQLADYNIQREREYSTGISTYKGEAQHAKEITGVMQEFMPALQQAGMQPAQWIQNMGRTHSMLVYGTPDQKIHVLSEVAKSYGIPIDAIIQYAQGNGVNPAIAQGMQQQSHLQQELQGVKQWMNQQQEQAVRNELAKFEDASRFPHFEQVRDKMAQLLEAGMANDPEEAYNAAVRLDVNAWNAEQQRQAAASADQQKQNAQAAARKARTAGVSVRTGTPVAPVPRSASDLRGTLEDAFDQVAGGGRV